VSDAINEADCDCGDAHAAAAAGHSGCLHCLLATDPNGANAVNQHNQTPLHLVQHSCDAAVCHDITEALLATYNEELINAVDASGQTPLQRTVWTTAAADATAAVGADSVTRRMCLACAKTLLYRGSAVHTAEQAEHFIAVAAAELHHRGSTAKIDCSIVVTLLQQCCPALDLNACLRKAVLQPAPEAYLQIPMLLQCGADIAQPDELGRTLLHLACAKICSGQQYEVRHVNCEVVRMLLEHDAGRVDARSTNGSTPLHMAFRYPAHLSMLLARGASVHALNNRGSSVVVSVLVLCSIRSHLLLVLFLMLN
jgi:ankyrin repeat protein